MTNWVLEYCNPEVKGKRKYWQCTYADGRSTSYGWGSLSSAEIITRTNRPNKHDFRHSHWIKEDVREVNKGTVKVLEMKVA